MIDRKAIRGALAQRLQESVTSVAYFSPTYLDFDQVPIKPALTIAMDSEVPSNRTGGLPTTWDLTLFATFHVQTGAKGESSDDIISDLLTELETALDRKPEESSLRAHTTLGGLVAAVYISGEVSYWSAGRQGQTVVDIPITIETNPEVPT